ncbi:MAG TPA: LPS export ABC transporter permease LptF [Geminicoccaceae bacterium]|nr:LPS export ABC transporter permease LptF [Geminicoccaceae bacterium]
MKTYARYLLNQLAWPLAFATLAFSGAVWLSQSLRLVDLIVNRGLPVTTFLYLTVLLFPSLLVVILPAAVFCAVLFAYYRLIAESELTVMKAVGLSNLQLASPALALGAAATVIGYAISLYFMPLAYRSFRDLQHELRQELSHILLEEGVFNSPTPGVTVYVRSHGEDGQLRGILFQDDRDRTQAVTMMAERGYLLEGEAGPRFVLLNGNRQELDLDDESLSILYFDSYTVELAPGGPPAAARWRKPKERYLHELLYPSDDPQDQREYSTLVAEGHQRLTWPLNALAFALIAAAALLPRRLTRRGLWRPVLAAVVAVLAVQALSLAAVSLATRSLALVPVLYLVPLVPGAIGLGLITGHLRPPRAIANATRLEPA